MEHTLTITITKSGRPVTNLQPYLGTDAHLTAFHAVTWHSLTCTPKATPSPAG